MLIAEADRDELRAHFAKELSGEVRLRLARHAGACASCVRAEALATELTALSDRLTLETDVGSEPLPELRLIGAALGEVRFVGLPSGYEFPALIASIIDVSRGATGLSAETTSRLHALSQRVHIQVFTTPT